MYEPRLQLLININKTEQTQAIKSIIDFLNIDSNSLRQDPLNTFNFIQFTNDINKNNHKKRDEHTLSKSFSCILFTSLNENVNRTPKNCNKWKLHHRLELKDERDKVVASQVFYELGYNLPLFCKSNCTPNTQNRQNQIIRLNINCVKYDLMLIFYRLLFDKYPNFIKTNFTLFILSNSNSHVEYQLSLKLDSSNATSSTLPITNSSLIYYIDSRLFFERTVSLLNDFSHVIIPNCVYSLLDPDGNQIYLVDASSTCSYVTSKQYFNSIGLGDCFLSKCDYSSTIDSPKSLLSDSSNDKLHSPTIDSNSDSGRWSNTSNDDPCKYDSYNACHYQKISAANHKRRSPRRLSNFKEMHSSSFKESTCLKKKSKSVTFFDANNTINGIKLPCKTTRGCMIESRTINRSKSCIPFDNYKDDDYDLLIKASSLTRKPNVGITRETRLRKSHTLNMIKSSQMPTVISLSSKLNAFNNYNHHHHQDHVILTDKYNNKLILPVAKF